MVLVRRGGVHDLAAEHCEQRLDGANLFDGHGHIVKVVDYGGIISLVPVLDNPEDEGAGALKMPGRSLLRRLKRVRNEERRREKNRR